jgi:S1-C subfamily serine protease
MNILDWCLIVLAIAYAVSGYWQGFIAGSIATVGLILGGVFGVWLAPQLLGNAAPSLSVSLGALAIVLVAASIGQALAQLLGSRVRDWITWRPARALDAVGGAILSVVAVLLVAWMLGVAISGSKIPGLSPQVRTSTVLAKVNSVVPPSAHKMLSGFDSVVGQTFFPRYLEPFAPERIVNVGPAPDTISKSPEVRRAERSVFKIRSNNKCGNGVEGSGFLYSPHRMMTNAHVVAGVKEPKVKVGSQTVDAKVVYYNPQLDVAVLDVPRLSGPYIGFDTDGKELQVGAVLGYPEDGPFDVQPARIRSQQRLRSPDIYGDGTVFREVFSLRSVIRNGNSGGPLVSEEGKVLGVVFAASVTDSNTGYALTAKQVAESAAKGITNNSAVSTQGCS